MPKDPKDPYNELGVSSNKKDVHEAIRNLPRGDFPGAFCKAFASPFEEGELALMHADGAGTKSAMAYLYWKETGDLSVFKNLARDAVVMNTDDLLCVGVCGEPTFFSSSIARNKNRIPKEIVEAVVRGTQEALDDMNNLGFRMRFGGGETADLGDLTRTLIIDATAFTSLPRKQFIDAGQLRPGLLIVGLASFGRANYEPEENSGIGSNGLTLARHVLLSEVYRRKYPETFCDLTDPNLVYRGTHTLDDALPGSALTIGQALLSPTRTYLPVFKSIFDEVPKSKIAALIHCTGGGQAKCLGFGRGVHVVKDDLFPLPPLYKALAEVVPKRTLYQAFNCGHRMEVFVADEPAATTIVRVAEGFGVEAKVVGRTEAAKNEQNHLSLHDDEGTLSFP